MISDLPQFSGRKISLIAKPPQILYQVRARPTLERVVDVSKTKDDYQRMSENFHITLIIHRFPSKQGSHVQLCSLYTVHNRWYEWPPRALSRHNVYTFMWHPFTQAPYVSCELGWHKSCPILEAVYLLALAVQSSRISTSILRKKWAWNIITP